MRPDARALLWLIIIAMATGLPLMLWFDEDGFRLPAIGNALRVLHAASSFTLVAVLLWHVAARLARGPRTTRGVRTGALALLTVALAVVSGAASAPGANGARLLDQIGLARFEDAVLWSALVHVAYASVVVVVGVMLHVRGTAWGRLLGRRIDAFTAVAATVLPALVTAGAGGLWTTYALAPPVPVLWAWTALLALGLYAVAPWIRGSAGRQTS